MRTKSITLLLIYGITATVCKSFSQEVDGYEIRPDNLNPSMISKETNTWVFGKESGLNFNQNPPAAIHFQGINHLEGSAAISDTSGNLHFCTNFSSNNLIMNLLNNSSLEILNSNNLYGHCSASQNSIIVSQPRSHGIYFIFTIGVPLPEPYGKGANYSILKAGIRDTVIIKNRLLLPMATEKVTAIHNSGKSGIWIIMHEWNSSKFYTWLLSSEGLSQPVISETGTVHDMDDFNNNAIGCMKASPDGSKLALAIYGKGIIELFEFDKSTGIVSNPITSNPVYTGVYGIEFSPDSKMLYASTNDYGFNDDFKSRLLQFTLEEGTNIFLYPLEIASDTIIDYLSLQLANDGKIYVAQSIRSQLPVGGYDHLGVIHNPTRRNWCNFNITGHQPNNGIHLNGGLCRIGTPAFIQSLFYIPKFTYRFNCFGDATAFKLVNSTNVDSVLWDFGDGYFSTELEPEHIYSENGMFNVKITDYYDQISYTDSLQIYINALPIVGINHNTDTVFLFPDSYVTLDAGEGYRTYLWNTGSTNQNIVVKSEASYNVLVSNSFGCYNSDSIYVKLFKAFAPTAFSPNGDGINDKFKFFYLPAGFKDYKLQIFDRIGKMVFESTNSITFWNGKLNNQGTNLPSEVYIWQLQINFFGKNKTYFDKGNITLLR